MRIVFLLLVLLAACNQNDIANNDAISSKDNVHNDTAAHQTQAPSQKAFPFILDSLLRFDSEAALKEYFGDGVQRSTGYLPEGEGTYPNTLLFPETANEVEFVWKDTVHFSKLSYVRTQGEKNDWQTAEGIRLGTTMKELEIWNGRPFSFYGFGWDYSGTVNWQGGKLAAKRLSARLMLPGDTVAKEFEPLLGDHEIKSSAALAQKANPVLDDILLNR